MVGRFVPGLCPQVSAPGWRWLVGEAIAGKKVTIQPSGTYGAQGLSLYATAYFQSFFFSHDPGSSAAKYPLVLVGHALSPV